MAYLYHNQTPANKERYQNIVGELIYLTHTRSAFAYAVSFVSQFMHNPSNQHMNAITRILAYLKSAPAKGVFSSPNMDILMPWDIQTLILLITG